MSEHILIALIGVAGAIVGSIATVAVTVLTHWLKQRAKEKRDKPRKELLLELLRDPEYKWRRLDTLTHVIGSDAETTKSLLLDLGARASEDGQPLWGLIERNPLGKLRQ